MVEMTIESDMDELPEDMERYADVLPEKLNGAMQFAADHIRDYLEEITPKRTGFTAESWTVIPVDLGEFVILNANEPVATFLSEGTAPHMIFGNPVLHWTDETGEHFAAHVFHPGTEPLNLEEQALDEAEPLIDELLDAADDEAWEESMT